MHGVPGSFWLLLHFILGLCCCIMVTVGLPTARQERGSSNDIVFGEDFVAILLDSPAEEDLVKINTSSEPSHRYVNTNKLATDYSRQTRSTVLTNYYPQTTSPHQTETTSELNPYSSSTAEGEKVVVLAVSVSTSTGDSRKPEMGQTISTKSGEEEAVIQTEYRPSIVAESSKSDFSVEESAPLTRDHLQNSDNVDNEYPARVQSVPSPQALPLINSNSNLYQGLDHVEDKDNLSPYHHQTLIFHDNPHDPEKAKSVSYTSVIHTLPQDSPPKQWQSSDDDKENSDHERQERHYDTNTNYGNNYYIEGTNKNVQLPNKENHNDDGSFTFTNSPLKSTPNEWRGLQQQQQEVVVETSTVQPTKSYDQQSQDDPNNKSLVNDHHHHHRIYGEPEKNYEVEESVSVLSNGRVHGVQPPVSLPKSSSDSSTKSTSTKQGDNNQKVGYVVEGRNYRKYRVEERTPDGFIVGEYGVVSHNDGSLRGVRYTADGTINPRLIYDALMKFLSL